MEHSGDNVTSPKVVVNEPIQPPATCGRKLSYPPEIDEQLVRWVKAEQNSGVLLSPDMLRREALQLIQPFYYDFKASTGWLDKFLTRHKLTLQPTLKINNNAQNGNVVKSSFKQDDSKEPGNILPPKLLPVSAVENTSLSMVAGVGSVPNDDDIDDDDDDDENDKKDDSISHKAANPERLKAFNMFVRLFIDENLDRLVPISKQPKEKISAIIMSCQRQFPEFSDRARKRIRTYLKSCRRSTRLREPSSKPSMTHIPASQLTEVNNILARACENETQEVAKRQRLDSGEGFPTMFHPVKPHDDHVGKSLSTKVAELHKTALTNSKSLQKDIPILPSFIPSSVKTPLLKLTQTEVNSVRSLIEGYRQSASFLHRSADELERLLKHCEAFADEGCKLVPKKTKDDQPCVPNGSKETASNNETEIAAPVVSFVEKISTTSVIITEADRTPIISTGDDNPNKKKVNDNSMESAVIESTPHSVNIRIPTEVINREHAVSNEASQVENSKPVGLLRAQQQPLNKRFTPPKLTPPISTQESIIVSSAPFAASKAASIPSRNESSAMPGQHLLSSFAVSKSAETKHVVDSSQLPDLLQLHNEMSPMYSEKIQSPLQESIISPYQHISPSVSSPKQVQIIPASSHSLHMGNQPSSQNQQHSHSMSSSLQSVSHPSHAPHYSHQHQVLSHASINHSNDAMVIDREMSPTTPISDHSQQMFVMRQHQHAQQQQQQQQQHHGRHQQRLPHSHTSGRHQSSNHHQTIFNFDTSPTQQQMLELRQQQHLHQRLSPHPMNYHALMSPVGSPHIHDMTRQSHMQDMTRQPHLQEYSRQVHLEEMQRQSLSEFPHGGHGMMFNSHQMH